jgi:transcription elongation factor Elf1
MKYKKVRPTEIVPLKIRFLCPKCGREALDQRYSLPSSFVVECPLCKEKFIVQR